jgi:hypothetical protein
MFDVHAKADACLLEKGGSSGVDSRFLSNGSTWPVTDVITIVMRRSLQGLEISPAEEAINAKKS